MIDDYRVPAIAINYGRARKLYKKITSKEKGVVMESIIVEINGVQYQNDQVKSFLTFFENGVLRISLTLNETTSVESTPTVLKQKPDVDLTQPYLLEGTEYSIDDKMYEQLKELSNLREHPEKRGIKETQEIQSNTYNVKDIDSFNNAITDLVKRENELFTRNYRFFAEVVKPVAIFESAASGTFKLTEKIVIVKADKKKED